MRILIVADIALSRSLRRRIEQIEPSAEIVEVALGRNLFLPIREKLPNLLLLDMGSSSDRHGTCGFEVLRDLARSGLPVPVVGVGDRMGGVVVRDAYRLGVIDLVFTHEIERDDPIGITLRIVSPAAAWSGGDVAAAMKLTGHQATIAETIARRYRAVFDRAVLIRGMKA